MEVLPLYIEVDDRGYAAEAKIMLGGIVIGYVGNSNYPERARENAIVAVAEVMKSLLHEHPAVTQKSSFS